MVEKVSDNDFDGIIKEGSHQIAVDQINTLIDQAFTSNTSVVEAELDDAFDNDDIRINGRR